MTYPIDVPFKKTRLLFLLLASVGFMGLCVWYITGPERLQGLPVATWVVALVGWIGLIMTMTASFFIIRMVRKNKVAIRIDTSGVHDHSTGISIGRIDWEDILEFRSTSVLGNHFILVDVNNPEEYISRGAGTLAQKSLNANFQRYGAPVTISTNNLQMKHEELLALLQNELKGFRALPDDLRLTLKNSVSKEWRKV
ncbi:STM3941 family protein [Neolewinella persica]|uniref:STM3941 family protein n=1 Tax=Neolewinella persica TaxID=70998 RepID=UPI00037607C3|nr:STM3941 family protein [Neolewinella persica]